MKVKKTKAGQRWVIPDIHGCFKTFRKTVEDVISLSKDDQVFLLGDYIDRGPNPSAVVDYILELQNKGFQVYPIRGNHEQNFLDAYEEYDEVTFSYFVVLLSKSKGLLVNNKPQPHHLDFFRQLPFYIETEGFILAHAAVKAGPDFSDTSYMMNQSNPQLTRGGLGGNVLVRGHKVTYIEEIEKAIAKREAVISLDNGCAYVKKRKGIDISRLGQLLAFNLDTYELKKVPNCEKD